MMHVRPDREIQTLYFAVIWQQKQKLSVRNGMLRRQTTSCLRRN
ncbi:hypothetical protein CIT292_07218 [Citrobacter youngae ATCC 29220]|uniref:Uncharacterized protein n=1 Tax=Citrobacter youngae ATCC 29220 TaxID=500640 RepID=D4B9S8_9ENTR|nr:hypothetical protein CIT292_07218 [Citrobacter youngae ATCC 29220]